MKKYTVLLLVCAMAVCPLAAAKKEKEKQTWLQQHAAYVMASAAGIAVIVWYLWNKNNTVRPVEQVFTGGAFDAAAAVRALEEFNISLGDAEDAHNLERGLSLSNVVRDYQNSDAHYAEFQGNRTAQNGLEVEVARLSIGLPPLSSNLRGHAQNILNTMPANLRNAVTARARATYNYMDNLNAALQSAVDVVRADVGYEEKSAVLRLGFLASDLMSPLCGENRLAVDLRALYNQDFEFQYYRNQVRDNRPGADRARVVELWDALCDALHIARTEHIPGLTDA